VLFLSYIVYLQMSGLLELRRHGKELQAQRALADQSEASRFTELREFLESEFARSTAQRTEFDEALRARLDAIEASLQTSIQQQGDSLSAVVGELGDRYDRERGAGL